MVSIINIRKETKTGLQVGLWWPVPVNPCPCTCTGTPSEICLYLIFLPTFDTISLHTTSIIHIPQEFTWNSSKNHSITHELVIWNLIPQNPRWKSYEFNQRFTNSSKHHKNNMISCLFYTNWGFTHLTSTNQGFM